jgi:hypothetical protein
MIKTVDSNPNPNPNQSLIGEEKEENNSMGIH